MDYEKKYMNALEAIKRLQENDSWEGCRRGEFDNIMRFHHVEALLCDRIEILPYLRPMSSMTEEEWNTYDALLSEPNPYELYDWMNSLHIDYRGLIEKGLALEVTEENNPYK